MLELQAMLLSLQGLELRLLIQPPLQSLLLQLQLQFQQLYRLLI
jgi:hypothetical protein